jgi:hypothetical protein
MSHIDVSGIPRAKPENPYNYNEDQLAEKALVMDKLRIIYPTVDPYYAALCYDMCVNTNPEEIEAIKERVEKTPFKYDYSNLQAELDAVKEKWKNEDLFSQSDF